MSETDTFKIELELPKNLVEAIDRVARTFNLTISQTIARCIRENLEGVARNSFMEWCDDLGKDVLKLLGKEP